LRAASALLSFFKPCDTGQTACMNGVGEKRGQFVF
jgi:hypothetical protein